MNPKLYLGLAAAAMVMLAGCTGYDTQAYVDACNDLGGEAQISIVGSDHNCIFKPSVAVVDENYAPPNFTYSWEYDYNLQERQLNGSYLQVFDGCMLVDYDFCAVDGYYPPPINTTLYIPNENRTIVIPSLINCVRCEVSP